jgi:hypothetical protein
MTDVVGVKVLLNLYGGFMGYRPGQALSRAAAFEMPLYDRGVGRGVVSLLDLVFEQLNVDDPDAAWAVDYRNRGHRSLSVGDVVVVGEQAWACEPAGWKPVAVEASQVWYDVGFTR